MLHGKLGNQQYLMKNHIKYLVLGGGLAGIGAASSLPKGEHLIVEKNNNLFGHASSFSFMDYSFDYGAHICHSINEEWLSKLNLSNIINHTKSQVLNYDEGEWIGYPVQNNLKDIDKSLANDAYIEILENQKLSANQSNYYEWAKSVYGISLTKKYYERFTKKYWRTPMKKMSTDWFNGRIIPINIETIKEGMKKETASEAVFKSFMYPSKNGFSELFDKLPNDLNYSLNKEVVKVDHLNKQVYFSDNSEISYDFIISTLPINEIFHITEFNDRDMLSISKDLKYLNLVVTAAVIEGAREFKKLPDWFYIYDDDIEMSRVKNISKVTQSKNENLALQFETFRRNDEEYNYEELLDKIENDCSRIFPTIDKKLFNFKHVFSKYSYVISCLDTERDRLKLISFLKSNGIYTCGLYGSWNYMWSDKSFFSGADTAKLVIEENS